MVWVVSEVRTAGSCPELVLNASNNHSNTIGYKRTPEENIIALTIRQALS